jgi:hypothetical protein
LRAEPLEGLEEHADLGADGLDDLVTDQTSSSSCATIELDAREAPSS